MVASRDNFPLLAELLAEQQRLDTPAARFASAHQAGAELQIAALATQLIPLTAPGPGEQYAFEVDLDSCTGCKSCVAACHALNGLDDDETWRDVGTLVSPRRAHPFTQTVTTACHHCADPACLNGCPVLAYEKDPSTGIVRHLDDQCIGCSYCILKCPYDVPKFSSRLGIVRKCDMCHGRLAEGEAPACAQACPTSAIRIVTVPIDNPKGHLERAGFGSAVGGIAEAEPAGRTLPVSALPSSGPRSLIPDFLPATADPAYTQPTTRYVSRRTLPENLIAGDAGTLRPQPAHWPLVIMLTLLPVAVGLNAVAAFALPPGPEVHRVLMAAVCAGAAGLGASVFHLGQPWRAWRIFLGWRRSWLSREALVFGTWFPVALTALADARLIVPSAVLGILGLACSAMIYIDTRRRFWRAGQTVPRFFGTSALVAGALLAPPVTAITLLVKLAWESRTHFDHSISSRLQRGPLARPVLVRDLLGLAAFFLLVAFPGWFALLPLLAGELMERYLFFRAVDAPKMPGMPA